MCASEVVIMFLKVLFAVFIICFSLFSCSKQNEPATCINSLDCPPGYICSNDGICIAAEDDGKQNQDDQGENIFPDNANNGENGEDDSEITDMEINDGYDNDEDGEIFEDDHEFDDDDCIPEPCGDTCRDDLENNCGTLSDCRCEPVKHFTDLADPDIYKESDNYYFISGTGGDTGKLVIYGTENLVNFGELFTYNPSETDENYNFCCIWAPDIYKTPENIYNIYFSAARVAKEEECNCDAVTTFYAVFDEEKENFGVAKPVDFGEGNPRYRTEPDCSPDGCEKTIRIDSALYNDGGTEWFFYTWFDNGNHISSIKFDDPSKIITNLQAVPLEGNINEGADVFKKNGKYYLFYSVNSFDADYAMKYIIADSVEELTRDRTPRWFSTPVRNNSNELLATHGHSSVVERYDDYYIFYHVGLFTIPGTLSGRDTYKSRLHFREDGSIHHLNKIDIGWSDAGEGFEYSIDVKPENGEWISACIPASTLQSNKRHTYTGICKDLSETLVHKAKIEKIRLFYSDDGTWGEPNMVEVDYNGFSTDISIQIPEKKFDHLKIRFAQQASGSFYKLDIKVKGSDWLDPCIGSLSFHKPVYLGGDFAYTFNGKCLMEPNNGVEVPIENIETVRICSDTASEFTDPVCFEKNYDGSTRYIEVW
jgi:GH43 family beta-xylosidase